MAVVQCIQKFAHIIIAIAPFAFNTEENQFFYKFIAKQKLCVAKRIITFIMIIVIGRRLFMIKTIIRKIV